MSIREGAAGVARVERGIGLDHVVDDSPAANWQRAPERGDDACRHRARKSVWIADRDDQLSDPQTLSVAELGWSQVARIDSKQGKVGQRIRADDLEAELAAVDE